MTSPNGDVGTVSPNSEEWDTRVFKWTIPFVIDFFNGGVNITIRTISPTEAITNKKFTKVVPNLDDRCRGPLPTNGLLLPIFIEMLKVD